MRHILVVAMATIFLLSNVSLDQKAFAEDNKDKSDRSCTSFASSLIDPERKVCKEAEDSESGLYSPIFFVGERNAGTKIIFIWSSNQQSVDAYKTYISPVIRKIDKLHIRVFFIQHFYDEKDLRGPGALFFCAKDQNMYAQTVFDYFMYASDANNRTVFKKYQSAGIYINKGIVGALNINGIVIADCLGSNDFYRRLARGAAEAELLRNEAKLNQFPTFIVDGSRFSMSSEDGLRKLRELAK